MESTPNPSSSDNKSSPKAIAGFITIDLPWIFGRIQEIMLNPNGCWDKIKAEGLLAKELFGRYIIPLAVLSAICGFIGQVLIGINLPFGTYRMPFFGGLIFHVISLVASLGSFFVSAFIIEKLAPKFQTQITNDQALRLVGFAATPSLLAGVLNITPGLLLSLLAILLSFYSLYLLWVGFQPMTAVPQNRKVAYFASSLVCSVISFLIIFGIVSTIFAPALPNELQDMQKFQENIQKLIPNPK